MRVSILQRAGCGRSQTVWGHNAGDVASRAVVDALTAISPNSRPSAFIAQIDDACHGSIVNSMTGTSPIIRQALAAPRLP
jgi:hypothetical protein